MVSCLCWTVKLSLLWGAIHHRRFLSEKGQVQRGRRGQSYSADSVPRGMHSGGLIHAEPSNCQWTLEEKLLRGNSDGFKSNGMDARKSEEYIRRNIAWEESQSPHVSTSFPTEKDCWVHSLSTNPVGSSHGVIVQKSRFLVGEKLISVSALSLFCFCFEGVIAIMHF